MVDLKILSDALDRYVHLQTYPLAVRLCVSSEEIPSEAKRPKRDFGKQMPVCQVFAVARRLGTTMAIGLEDQQCPLANLMLGFLPPKKEFLNGSFHWSFLPSFEANRNYSRSIKMLEYNKYRYVLIAPIDKATFEPNLVVIYGTPAQVGRMVQARLYLDGGVIDSHAGLGATCSLIIARTVLTDECKFVLIGLGPRRFAHDQDHEMAFTIPASKVELVLEGLKGCEENTTYRIPTPLWMDYEIAMAPKYQSLQDFLMKEDK